mmetsp:Transcript_16775/g.25525  ORF Transcript_16775/g.25525 Transcript_16775/m.25525 type:complete len:234 (+) Transcript_16775:151-852(+)
MNESASLDHAHALYRRKVCNMLSSLEDPFARKIESALGKRAMIHDTTISNNSNEASLDMRVPPQLIHCHECGAWLQGRVRIKSIKRGRTRRRRASRRKAAWKRAEARESKNNHQRIKHDDTPLVVDPKELSRLFQVTDGRCKNIIVQTCNNCGFQCKTAGTIKGQKKKGQNTKTVPAIAPVDDSIGRDFIKVARTNKKDKGSPLNLLISDQKKKKRKKMDKTGLMNFLSSLND